MNKALLHPEIQKFIRENQKTDITRLILSGSPFSEVSAKELAVQITGLKTSKKKLPTWFNAKNIIYPPKLNLEQTSSEITARYKASLVKGTNIADITGGFGIDSFFFAEYFKELTYCELNADLAEIVEHNFRVLNAKNIEVIAGNGLEFLRETNKSFDWIYLDPARRDKHGGKVFKLADCFPDIPLNLDLLFSKARKLLIKTSPLLDLKAGIKELKHVAEIHIVSVNNEVKELLWILEQNYSREIKISTVNFTKKRVQKFEGYYKETASKAVFGLPRKYLFEPNPAVMKSSLFDQLAKETGTLKLHKNSHLFTSEKPVSFPGREFLISDIQKYNVRYLKKELKIKKANITTRNFPESVEKIRKIFKIKEGGDTYLFFTTNLNEEKIILICEKKN